MRKAPIAVALVVTLVLGLVHADVPGSGYGSLPSIGMDDLRAGARAMFGFRQPRPKTPPLALVDVPRRQAAPVGAAMPEPKRVREVPERRTANASFFQLADGRTQAEVSSTPVHYRDAAGRWQPIDTRLVRVDAGYGNSTNTFASRFGTTSTGLARFDLDGRTVAVGVAGPQRPLVPTAAAGDTVRYPAAFGDGADLAYRVTGTAMKGAIVLTRPPAEDSFTLTLDLNGVTARQLPDGAIGFFVPERDTQPLLVMPKPFMYDAKGDSRSPYGAAWSGAVSQTLRQENGRAMVVVRADRGWLTDPARAYPVTIDPTIKIQPTVTQSQDISMSRPS